MRAHFLSSRQGRPVSFRRDSLLYRLTSVLLAWAMIMSSIAGLCTDQPRVEWVHSWDFGAIPKPAAAPAPHRAAPQWRLALCPEGEIVSPRLAGNPTIAALQSPTLSGNQDSDLLVQGGWRWSAYAAVAAAQDSPLQVSVGFADNSSASANFPEPWNETNPLINFVGGGTVYRAGAIRLDNPGSLPVTVDSVKVDLGRPGPVFQLWQNIVVPAGGSADPDPDAGWQLQYQRIADRRLRPASGSR